MPIALIGSPKPWELAVQALSNHRLANGRFAILARVFAVILFLLFLYALWKMPTHSTFSRIVASIIFLLLLNAVAVLSHFVTNNTEIRMAVESILFFAVLAVLFAKILPREALAGAFAFIVGSILVLEIGSNLVDFYYHRIEKLVAKEESATAQIFKTLDIQRSMGEIAYKSINLGAIIGLLLALIFLRSPLTGLLFGGLGAFAICLLVVTALDTMRIGHPLAELDIRPEPPNPKADLAFLGMVTKIRRIYLYDGFHNILLLSLIILFISSLLRPYLVNHWFFIFLALLGAVFLFNEIPFVIGQMILHQRISDRYTEAQRQELAEQMAKAAPITPQISMIIVHMTSSGAGALLYVIGEHILKETAKGH